MLGATTADATLWGAVERSVKARERGIHGAGIDEALDTPRLVTQQAAVLEVLRKARRTQVGDLCHQGGGQRGWMTAEEIARKVERMGIACPVTSASAHVRNLRKKEGGGHAIAWRYREGTRMAEYRMEEERHRACGGAGIGHQAIGGM